MRKFFATKKSPFDVGTEAFLMSDVSITEEREPFGEFLGTINGVQFEEVAKFSEFNIVRPRSKTEFKKDCVLTF